MSRKIFKSKGGKAIKADKKLIPVLQDLRWMVENINKLPDITKRGGKFSGIDPNMVYTTKVDGWEFGYKLEDHGLHMTRKIFIKNLEAKFSEIPDKEKDPVMIAVFDTMLDRGMPGTEIVPIAEDCIMITQDFVPLVLTKSDSAKGHIKIDDNALREVIH